MQDEDEIDASVRAVNEMLGCLPSSACVSDGLTSADACDKITKSLLLVEHRYS